jgi:hypothetical protein
MGVGVFHTTAGALSRNDSRQCILNLYELNPCASTDEVGSMRVHASVGTALAFVVASAESCNASEPSALQVALKAKSRYNCKYKEAYIKLLSSFPSLLVLQYYQHFLGLDLSLLYTTRHLYLSTSSTCYANMCERHVITTVYTCGHTKVKYSVERSGGCKGGCSKIPDRHMGSTKARRPCDACLA